MKFGIQAFATDESMDPLRLARAVEERGFESLFLPDHTHIPVRRETPYPQPPYGDLPRPYFRTADPFVVLAAMAAATESLLLGTAVCLVVERDPLVLAKQVATLDWLSGGRLVLGVGAGWNLEEMRNHGTDPTMRVALMGERVQAMKEIWTRERAEFHGRFVDFDPVFSWPKPIQTPHPPVLVGGNGPTVLDRVLRYGDGWIPGHQRDLAGLGGRIRELRDRSAALARPRPNVTLVLAQADHVDQYREIGVDRIVFPLGPADDRTTRSALDRLAARCFSESPC